MHGVHSIRLEVVRQRTDVSQPALPRRVYADAVMELCGRIWCALERLAQLCDLAAIPEDATLLLTAATLRLELLVITDSCKSASWAAMLLTSERRNLCSMLGDVLGAIAVSSDELKRSHIECAQDRVFDEVLAQQSRISGIHRPTAVLVQ